MEVFHASLNSQLEMLIGNDFLSVWPLHSIVIALFLHNPWND